MDTTNKKEVAADVGGLTHEAIRAVGGIIHRDGNIFFTNLEVLNKAIASTAAPAVPDVGGLTDERIAEIADRHDLKHNLSNYDYRAETAFARDIEREVLATVEGKLKDAARYHYLRDYSGSGECLRLMHADINFDADSYIDAALSGSEVLATKAAAVEPAERTDELRKQHPEAHKLAPILWGMCEGGGTEKGVDIYGGGYQADDGDVYVRRAGELLIEQAAEIDELVRYIDLLGDKLAEVTPHQALKLAGHAGGKPCEAAWVREVGNMGEPVERCATCGTYKGNACRRRSIIFNATAAAHPTEAAPAAPEQAVPEGWKLVPVEPTEAMVNAAIACGKAATKYEYYAAMLAAAPVPPVPAPAEADQSSMRTARKGSWDVLNDDGSVYVTVFNSAEASDYLLNGWKVAEQPSTSVPRVGADTSNSPRLKEITGRIYGAAEKGMRDVFDIEVGELCNYLAHVARQAQAAPADAPQAERAAVPDIAAMVNRFLGWKLPKDFYPDCGITFKHNETWGAYPNNWPTGTNLFTADQAKAMFEYTISAPIAQEVELGSVPAELTDEAIDELWSAMPGGADGWLKQFGYRQFARSIARHVLVRVAASMAGTIRPTDDELWEQTIGERDHYHDMADKLAGAIAKHFGADIGEHSNMNCPWIEALDVIDGGAPSSTEASAQVAPIADLLAFTNGSIQDYPDFHEDLERLSEPGLAKKQAKIIRKEIYETIDARVRNAVKAAFAAQAAPAEQRDALDEATEGAEIIDSLIKSIEKHGNYSQEAMLTYLGQLKQCLDPLRALRSTSTDSEKGGA